MRALQQHFQVKSNNMGRKSLDLGLRLHLKLNFKDEGPLRTNIYVRIISVLLLVTQETELCL